MAVTYGFYDSLNHDRLYNAQQMSAIFDGIINDGVFMSVGNQFHTVAGTGMQVIVKSGRAWFDSTWTLNDAEYPLSIDAADVLLTRIDAVVLEVNSEVATRANTIKVVKGTPASTPAKPTLTNTATIHQHALAYVTVAKNTTAITNSMIEIVVGKTETPYVTAILQTTDITDLYNQWEDYFQNWFDNVRSTLDGDVALNLQNQITSLRRETLKDTTPPIIGLSSSATPDDMFQALAKTGDLHVWRKRVKNAPDVPAGYNLGVKTTKTIVSIKGNSSVRPIIYYSSSVSVSDSGNVSLINPSSIGVEIYTSSLPIVGKFFYIDLFNAETSDLIQYKIYFVPSDTDISVNDRPKAFSGVVQEVTGYAKVPAGTTATYPVSTNPNAYQEGSYAKPAGYTLGNVVTGIFRINAVNHGTTIQYANSVSVENNGVVTLVNKSEYHLEAGEDSYNNAKKLAGKFIIAVCNHTYCEIPKSVVLFIPANTTISFRQDVPGNEGYGIFFDRYQPVTGYAAIPANTTIEYLGKLGNKSRVQVVSYVGTGTYGKDHPSSITFDFIPTIINVSGYYKSNSLIFGMFLYPQIGYGITLEPLYSDGGGFGRVTCKTSGKTVSWYANEAGYQLNLAETTYFAIAIG